MNKKCFTFGCQNTVAFRPVLSIYAPVFVKNSDRPAILAPEIGVCAICAAKIKPDMILTEEIKDMIRRVMREKHLPQPDFSRTQVNLQMIVGVDLTKAKPDENHRSRS